MNQTTADLLPDMNKHKTGERNTERGRDKDEIRKTNRTKNQSAYRL